MEMRASSNDDVPVIAEIVATIRGHLCQRLYTMTVIIDNKMVMIIGAKFMYSSVSVCVLPVLIAVLLSPVCIIRF